MKQESSNISSPRFDDDSCRFYQENLQAFIDLELDRSTQRILSAHLRECPACVAEKDGLERQRLDLVGSLVDAPELPTDFSGKVVDLIHSRTRRKQTLRRRFALGLAAGLLIGSAFVTLLFEVVERPTLRQARTPEEVAQRQIAPAQVTRQSTTGPVARVVIPIAVARTEDVRLSPNPLTAVSEPPDTFPGVGDSFSLHGSLADQQLLDRLGIDQPCDPQNAVTVALLCNGFLSTARPPSLEFPRDCDDTAELCPQI
jgi:hypothetical protein